MKTRDRILLTSLDLFNEEGEQNVTTVDIANEMDISPGNLYYHFKGKESIIDALYNQFDHEFSSLLHQSTNELNTLEQHWLFMYVIFQEIYKFRFFYLNASELLLKYPDLERRFRRLLQLKKNTIEGLCKHLIDSDFLEADDLEIKVLAESITMSFLYWFPYQHLMNPNVNAEQQIHSAVFHILMQTAPYSGDSQEEFTAAIKLLYQNNVTP